MMVLYSTLIVLICVLVLSNTYRVWRLQGNRFKSKWPAGKPTMFDVRHLLLEGERDAAIQVYCEIFHTTPMRARKDIEELERSLKV